jgi:cephalosporin hydroxylase
MEVDFNRDKLEGQLSPFERRALYNVIVKSKPEFVFEVGTWNGGGSTYIIASALADNGIGMLYSAECNEAFYHHAVDLYNNELKYLRPFVCLNLGESQNVFPRILETVKRVDLAMLDGREDPQQTLVEYDMFNPYCFRGSYIACHDWNTPKMDSMKTILVGHNRWELEVDMANTFTGFMIFRKA